MKKWLITSILLFICKLLFSQGVEGYQANLTIENDILGYRNEDENYTGGIKLEVLTPGLKCKYLVVFPFRNKADLNLQRYSFGGTGYTPRTLEFSEVQYDDRPYASLVFLSFGNISFFKKLNFLQSDIYVGFMGLDGPGNVQSYIHENHWFGTTRPVPQGWHNQIADSLNAFVVNYNISSYKMLFKGFSKMKFHQ
ncbi:MAG: DUF2219 family protein [Bacteroidetes bacterium]|nr:DUF2219 family protein [Bacteroidota bacterium]